MHILQIYTHSPESCPIGNPKNLQTSMDWLKKVDILAAKYKINVVGIWTDRWGHKSWAVYEAPNIETFGAFEQEPENLEKIKFTEVETRIVTVSSETLTFFERIRKL